MLHKVYKKVHHELLLHHHKGINIFLLDKLVSNSAFPGLTKAINITFKDTNMQLKTRIYKLILWFLKPSIKKHYITVIWMLTYKLLCL